ncbi:uncharacterized protein [Nicotiana tomentosiformis]|uniref:uncharacterized protein n=1 Tax=Nicotiana tomentosiformis TaxID=4098 RepID=UPI00388CD878
MEDLIKVKAIVRREEEAPNVTTNLLPTHNKGSVVGMICDDGKFDPALKSIVAMVMTEEKPKSDINVTKRMLASKFNMKDLGVADVILGIRIHKTPQGLVLSQSHYIEKVYNKARQFKDI